MKLIIVRHGQTVENAAKIIQGHLPGNLNKIGKAQAKKVAQRLKDEKVDIAYVSDLKRAVDTAQEILAYHPEIEAIYTEEIRERPHGIYEGKPRHTRAEAQKESGLPMHEFVGEGGESFEKAKQRLITFFDKIVDKHPDDTVLVVAHGGVLTAFYLHLFKASWDEYDKYHPENTAVTILEVDNNKKHTVHVLNCIKHLDKQ